MAEEENTVSSFKYFERTSAIFHISIEKRESERERDRQTERERIQTNR